MKFKNNYSLSHQKNKKSIVKPLVVLLLISTIILSCSKDENSTELQTLEKNTVVFNSLEAEILSLVNIHRESLGLTRVSVLSPAYLEANGHTKYMIAQGKTSHDNFDIRSKNLMTTVSAKLILENVAAGYPSAENVIKAWLGSDSHRKNIENPSVQYMGISVQQNKSGINFFTQIFIGK
ncbi:MAG: CAP domain-containing protein [Flavobacteriaceae bacterium]|nr:CAP domain-containing protein [Flavobacteriaceae bacterium]